MFRDEGISSKLRMVINPNFETQSNLIIKSNNYLRHIEY